MLEQQSKSNTTALSIYSAPSWFEMLFEVYPKRKSLSYEVGVFFVFVLELCIPSSELLCDLMNGAYCECGKADHGPNIILKFEPSNVQN